MESRESRDSENSEVELRIIVPRDPTSKETEICQEIQVSTKPASDSTAVYTNRNECINKTVCTICIVSISITLFVLVLLRN
jgi:hypothetical protein